MMMVRLLPLLIVGSTPSAGQAVEGERVVKLWRVSDLDDPHLIRSVTPAPGHVDWLRPADFPADVFAGGMRRGVTVKVTVDRDGRVAGCDWTITPADFAGWAERACALISERGRFRHAIDAGGRASVGTIVMSVSFMVLAPGESGGRSPAPPPPGARNTAPVPKDAAALRFPAASPGIVDRKPTTWLDIDARGKVVRCRIRSSTGSDAGDTLLCAHARKLRFEPARDPRGKPVEAASQFVAFEVTA